jgi:ABC-type transport system substrate-binding protein
LLLAAACTGGDDDAAIRSPDAAVPEAARGGTAVVGVIGEPATLDPYSPIASDLTFALVRPIYPSLYSFLPDGTTRPYLASSLSIVDAGARVELRAARWSNARAITARDVVASVRRARPPSGFAGLTASARGRRSVLLRGDRLDWEQTLATAAFVLPRGRASRTVAGGPFMIARRHPGLEIVYTPNPRWWGRAAYLDQITVQFLAGTEVLLGLLGDERLDVVVPLSTVNLDDRLDAYDVEHVDTLGWESIQLDLDGATLDEAERRRLVAAIDREVIEAGFVRGDGRIARTLHPEPGPEGAAGKFEAGPAEGEGTGVITMAAASGDELTILVQRVVQTQLASAGFDVELVRVEPSTFYGPWAQDDPTDAAVRRVAGAPGLTDDPGDLGSLRAWPLLHVETVIAWRPGLHGLEPNPTLEGPLWNADKWWRDPEP